MKSGGFDSYIIEDTFDVHTLDKMLECKFRSPILPMTKVFLPSASNILKNSFRVLL